MLSATRVEEGSHTHDHESATDGDDQHLHFEMDATAKR